MTTRIDAFAEQAKQIAREAIAERDMAVSNFHKAVDNIAQLQADKAELLAGLRLAERYWYSDHPNDTVSGHTAHAAINAIITKHSGVEKDHA